MIRAGKDYKQGEEVFNHYGDHASTFCWIEYGFVNDKKIAKREPIFVDVKHIQHLLNLEGVMIQEHYRLDPKPSESLLEVCNLFADDAIHALITLIRMTRHVLDVARCDEAWKGEGWNIHCGRTVLDLGLETCDEALAWVVTQQFST
jgi:hypothetical protein